MGKCLHFGDKEIYMVEESTDLAEDLVTSYFNLSSEEWKNCHYDLKTLADLSQVEITDKAFAQVCKYECVKEKGSKPPLFFDLYRICLQDNKILNAVKRSCNRIELKPLILYIVTHELSHVVRFSKYFKNFSASPEEKELEEANVHSITYEMLGSMKDKRLNRVLDYYRNYRWELG
ncbi:MAG: hypothetical protein ABIJ37_08535 [Pseudomonadota bacterium]